MKFSLLINMKMPTIVGIFIFISRENFMLSRVEYEKSFITSEPDKYFFIIISHLKHMLWVFIRSDSVRCFY